MIPAHPFSKRHVKLDENVNKMKLQGNSRHGSVQLNRLVWNLLVNKATIAVSFPFPLNLEKLSEYPSNMWTHTQHAPEAVHDLPACSASVVHGGGSSFRECTVCYSSTDQCLNHCEVQQMILAFGKKAGNGHLESRRCHRPPDASGLHLQTVRELLLPVGTLGPSGVATHAAWWKCWKPAPLGGQPGRIQCPQLLQVGPRVPWLYRKILF